jgi:biotin/methionine sulfoxide reductase
MHYGAIGDARIDVVNISPIRDDADPLLNARWLPCRPNSDVAIMLAIVHTLMLERLHDRAFLDRYCVGFDRFAAYVMGATDGQPKDAAWAARSWVEPAPDIRCARLPADSLTQSVASLPTAQGAYLAA